MFDGFNGLWGIDALIAFTLVEALALWLWHRSGRGGVDPAGMLPNMAAGLCLMLALRAALTGPRWEWIALFIMGSGVAHAWDLRRRWLRERAAPSPSPSPLSTTESHRTHAH